LESDTAEDFEALRASIKERRKLVEADRMKNTLAELKSLGYGAMVVDRSTIQFEFDGHTVTFYPYTGWHTGKSIKDGRGWRNLRKQITRTK
jgi:putative heme iron utilization protein